MHQWFTSYLEGRIQKVKIGGKSIGNLHVNSRVPQRKVLEPILFLIYVNDIGRLQLQGSLYSFADDTAV